MPEGYEMKSNKLVYGLNGKLMDWCRDLKPGDEYQTGITVIAVRHRYGDHYQILVKEIN